MHGASPLPHCAACPFKREERLCCVPGGKHPPDCPSAARQDLVEQSRQAYARPDIRHFARQAAKVERHSYARLPNGGRMPCRPRILEIVAFAKAMGYQRLGLLFCIGLRREAAGAAEIFKAQGLEVASVICKAGGLSKSELDLTGEDLLNPEHPESMCNPLLQAELMNRAQVDFNVLLGLCVGHDTLALRHLEAPATVLAVKDRMLGHNPLAAVQCSDSYFNYLKTPM
ncbi:DUF1847 domain-containing protein [Desulfovibrio sp. PG-178-WT-4]|uniref:DUF1847 domain-containing protein n=1 Tax=Desulfovibrio porci TaxID=2605782 RepID=A0A6L5XIY3_9BACT|nr:DUF1847 domain-containing protein [Desulfovibrio porci]MDY3809306.1 DUF1847 domain-containing protein [Desulfovibrio porci]MSS27097.1 DUF1847 domain-containing protein [Desulfovibrio porci]